MLDCDGCFLSSFVYFIGALTIASKVLPFLANKIKGSKPVELQEKNFKRDVVYFYQFPGSATSPSMSPFCVKIEAFLRLHDIDFERRNTLSDRGQNNLLPFIELNGEQHADSQIIVRRLTQAFNLKTYADDQSAAIGHAVDRLIDNHTFNLILLARKPVVGKFMEAMATAKGLPAFLMPLALSIGSHFLAKKIRSTSKIMKFQFPMSGRGSTSIGSFKENEVKELLRNDLTQLQTILGDKDFLMGAEPTTVDCTALGQFGAAYAIPSARHYLHEQLESKEFASLNKYLERTKTRIFGDAFHDTQ